MTQQKQDRVEPLGGGVLLVPLNDLKKMSMISNLKAT
jgi:hypothetical protein